MSIIRADVVVCVPTLVHNRPCVCIYIFLHLSTSSSSLLSRPKQETLQRKSAERKAVQAARKGSRGAARMELNRRGGKPTEEAVKQQLQRGRGRTSQKKGRGTVSRAEEADDGKLGLSVEGPTGGAFGGGWTQRRARAGNAAAMKEKGTGRRRRRKNLPSDKH